MLVRIKLSVDWTDADVVENAPIHDDLAVPAKAPPTVLGGMLGTQANVRLEYGNIVAAQFLERLVEEDLSFVRGDGWRTTVGRTAIPGEIILSVRYSRIRRYEALARLEGCVVHLALKEHQLDLKIAARDEATAGLRSLLSKMHCRVTPAMTTVHLSASGGGTGVRPSSLGGGSAPRPGLRSAPTMRREPTSRLTT